MDNNVLNFINKLNLNNKENYIFDYYIINNDDNDSNVYFKIIFPDGSTYKNDLTFAIQIDKDKYSLLYDYQVVFWILGEDINFLQAKKIAERNHKISKIKKAISS